MVVCIVNNNINNKEYIDSLLNYEFVEFTKNIKVIHRVKTLVAIDSWFDAIDSIANDDEQIHIIGDDDFCINNDTSLLYKFVDANKADIVITDFISRIYINSSFTKYYTIIEKFEPTHTSGKFNFNVSEITKASFISTHVYKYSDFFKECLREAKYICSNVKGVDWVYSSAVLPILLPLIINYRGGNVAKFNKKHVLRGGIVTDLKQNMYSDGGTTYLFTLIHKYIFNMEELKICHELRNSLLTYINNAIQKDFYLFYIISSKYSLTTEFQSKVLTGIDAKKRIHHYFNYKRIINYFGFNALRVRILLFFRGYNLHDINSHIKRMFL